MVTQTTGRQREDGNWPVGNDNISSITPTGTVASQSRSGSNTTHRKPGSDRSA